MNVLEETGLQTSWAEQPSVSSGNELSVSCRHIRYLVGFKEWDNVVGDSGQFMLLKRERDWTMGMDHRYPILSIIDSSLSLVA